MSYIVLSRNGIIERTARGENGQGGAGTYESGVLSRNLDAITNDNYILLRSLIDHSSSFLYLNVGLWKGVCRVETL
jgi:hypothetical protein